MESNLNHEKILMCCSNVGMIVFAFEAIHDVFQKEGKIEALKLTSDGKELMDETTFRDMLFSVISIDWDESKLTKEKVETLDKITIYLSTPHQSISDDKMRVAEEDLFQMGTLKMTKNK